MASIQDIPVEILAIVFEFQPMLDGCSMGHLDVLQWVREQSPPCPWDHLVCSAIARGGHLDVLQWARENGCLCPLSLP